MAVTIQVGSRNAYRKREKRFSVSVMPVFCCASLVVLARQSLCNRHISWWFRFLVQSFLWCLYMPWTGLLCLEPFQQVILWWRLWAFFLRFHSFHLWIYRLLYSLSLRLRCGRARLYGSGVYYYYTIGDVYSSLGHRYYYVGVFLDEGFGLVAHENWLVRKLLNRNNNQHQEKCDFKLFQLCSSSSSSGFYRDERSNTSFLRDPRRRERAHFLTLMTVIYYFFLLDFLRRLFQRL